MSSESKEIGGLQIKDLAGFQMAVDAGHLTQDEMQCMLLTLIRDDIDKTDRLIYIIKNEIPAATAEYKALNEKYEKLQKEAQKSREQQQLGNRGTYGVRSEHLSQEEMKTGVPASRELGQEDPLNEDTPDRTGETQEQQETGSDAHSDQTASQSTGSDQAESKKTGSDGNTGTEKTAGADGAGNAEKSAGDSKNRDWHDRDQGDRTNGSGKKGGNPNPVCRTTGSFEKQTADLPREYKFLTDGLRDLLRDEKDAKYISVNYEKSARVMYHPAFFYVRIEYSPVFTFTKAGIESVADRCFPYHERRMYRPPHKAAFLPGSHTSPECVAHYAYEFVRAFMPAYRIEQTQKDLDYPISRSTMLRQMYRAAELYLVPLIDFFIAYLFDNRYIQMDETTWEVIMDGRKQGTKSYIWLMITSELLDCPKVAVYFYSRTRSEEFLEDLFADFLQEIDEAVNDAVGGTEISSAVPSCEGTDRIEAAVPEGAETKRAEIVIKDDAYQAYAELEKHADGTIKVSFCIAHLRRYFFLAYTILVLSIGRSKDEEAKKRLAASDEWQILLEISRAEREDTKLKKLSREERLRGRIQNVKPHLDNAVRLATEADAKDPKHSDMTATMSKAVTYLLNCKKDGHIDSFLYDPDIPCDNSASERNLRPVAVQRHSSLFSFSVQGAIDRMILMSVARTAYLNGADVYLYFCYLFTEMPEHLARKEPTLRYMPDMMPWSEAYREFARNKKAEEKKPLNFQCAPPSKPKIVNGQWQMSEAEEKTG